MKHLGDVTKIKGAEIEPVEVITFGAPCTDLSVAGKRLGLTSTLMGDEETTRSGLFYDSIRIIKEMRKNDKANGRADIDVRPRFSVYENVTGAFSSNKGADWKSVLEETIKVIEPEIPDIPVPDKGWPDEGVIVDGDGKWSICWSTHDAQFWGVPQRRKRIALVADYNGLSAARVMSQCYTTAGCRSKVLPQSESVSRNPHSGNSARERTSDGTEGSATDSGEYDRGSVRSVLSESESRDSGRVGVDSPITGGKNWDGTDTCFTLTANNANGAQRMPDKENLSCILDEAYGCETYHCETVRGDSNIEGKGLQRPNGGERP